jgi:hypothetical protein
MKTIEMNIGLHSKTLGKLNPIKIINSLTGRGFTVTAYRVARSSCADGAEWCLAVRCNLPRACDILGEIYRIAVIYEQDCIAFAGLVGPACENYTAFDPQYWISPDAPPALSDCQAVQAKHLERAEQITRDIIASMPEIYRDVLLTAAHKHAQQTGFVSPFI